GEVLLIVRFLTTSVQGGFMVGSWRLWGPSKGLASRAAMPAALLPSWGASFGAHRLRPWQLGCGRFQQLHDAFHIYHQRGQHRLQQHFSDAAKTRTPRSVMPHHLAQLPFDLRMRSARFLVLRRSHFLVDLPIFRLVFVLDDDTATPLGRIRQALGAHRTLGTLRSFELVAIARVLTRAAALPGRLTGGTSHFAVLRVDDRQRETLG